MLWVCVSAFLVFLMQAGFLCLESGLTRSKNTINVAFKNLADFSIAVILYWMFGFALMFGTSFYGWVGNSHFFLAVQTESAWTTTFFIFEVMFCATATTILSGAVAERFRLVAYLFVTAFSSGLIYPLFGHWAWGGALLGTQGWLQARGFIDFAGSSVVHSVGGWVSLAALLVIGARTGRFLNGQVSRVNGSNLPLSMLGLCLLLFGWFGFNGGSTLALNDAVPAIIANTLLSGIAGSLTTSAIGWYRDGYAEVSHLINGMLAGLVAITAGCHAVSIADAVLIGAVGGIVFLLADNLLLRLKIDDAVGAVPTHLAAGIWGTLAVGILGDLSILDTGLSRFEQISIQLLGILVCALWSFGSAYFFLSTLNRFFPLRVSFEDEEKGLNLSEHGAKTDLIDLLTIMQSHEKKGYVGNHVPAEPFTEVGQIARQYNRVMTALDKATAQLRLIINDIRDGVVTFNRNGVITSFNTGAEQLFGYSANTIIGRSVAILWLREDPHFLTNVYEMTLPVGSKREITAKRQDQTVFMVELTVTQSWLQREVIYTTLIRDITERKRMEEQLSAEKELAQTTLASIGDAVITTDSTGKITYLNPVAETLTGWEQNEVVGQNISLVYHLIDEITRNSLQTPAQRLNQNNITSKTNHAILIRRDGHEVALEDSVAPIRNQQGVMMGMVVVFHDVTKSRKLAQQLSYQAKHDALTGLVNRTEFEQRLHYLLENSEQERARHVLCYMDLDNFKIVNDTCGHVAGDELLRQITALFKTRVRGTDTLARLGGDEFGVLFQNCGIEQAENVAEQLREAVQKFRFIWNNQNFGVGVSIGLVELTGNGETLASLQAAADTACYIAKDTGRNRIHVFQQDDLQGKEQPEPVQWLHRIEHALQADRLRLLFQSLCPLRKELDDNTGYYEIFVSLLDNNNRLIPPGAFIPAAERYNIMPLIDRWVVRNTLAWLGDYIRQGKHPIHLCMVNLSVTAVGDEDFLKLVAELMSKHQIPPNILCFEVGESILIANIAKSAQFIHALHAMGCYFSVDDFGRGLSSFSYFKELHVDYLKIDGAFVKDIAKEEIDYALVASINHIAHIMGFQTIAEFVENEGVLSKLREIGVDFAQGYHVAEPKPLEQLAGVWMMPR
ncbi:ammonium transporter [Beggiatoa leptomitoformis]|nr:ammonium transporter [Beggiatoa leptomitoformis]